MDFPYKLEDIRLIYAFHAFACNLVDEKLCTQRCTPKSEGAANFSFCPEVLRCRDHIKLEMNQIVCWVDLIIIHFSLLYFGVLVLYVVIIVLSQRFSVFTTNLIHNLRTNRMVVLLQYKT